VRDSSGKPATGEACEDLQRIARPEAIAKGHALTLIFETCKKSLFLLIMIRTLQGKTPVIGQNCFITENSVILGDVIMGDECSVWFNVVIRGDVHSIRIGNRTNIQDGAILHCTYKKFSLTIGNNVSIGHGAIVHGCVIEDNVLIGMGAKVLDGAIIRKNSIIAAGAVVLPNTEVPEGSLFAGNPATFKKQLDEKAIAFLQQSADNYVMYKEWYSGETW